MESTGGPIRGALARLRSAPLWVWITILLTFGLLIFAYLQYRKNGAANSTTGTTGSSSSAGLGTVPGDGTGQPLWNTADTSGFVAGNVTDLAALLAYLQSQQTPNAPTTATPTPAGGPILAPGPSGGARPPIMPGGPIVAPGPSGGVKPPTPPTTSKIPQPPGAPTGTATNPATNSSGTYFKITQAYSPATAGTTTIAGLAHRFNTTIANLLRLNPQVNPTTQTTYVGEYIRIK